MQTLFGGRLSRHALNAAGPPALTTPERGMSFAELLRRVQNCAGWLAAEGCRREQIVGITVAGDMPHLVTSLALLSLGVPQVCLPTSEPLGKRADLADRLDLSRVVGTDPQHALPGRPFSLLAPDRYAPAGNALPAALDADPHAPSVYHTSSGTTGQPKIYALSQHNITWRAEQFVPSERIGRSYRSTTFLPIEDQMGRARFHYCVAMGCASVLQGLQPWSVQDLCSKLDVTYIEMSGLQLASLVADRRDLRLLPRSVIVSTGGAPVPAKLRQEFKVRFGIPLFIHYGAREFGRISATDPRRDDGDVESLGPPVPWIDFEIVDAEGRALPRGEIGEVRVRGECMASSYYRDPEANARHFKDGWFYPRDMASLTPAGRVCLHGRSDDMMNLNGIKIFPAEIERVLEEHPAVKTAAAFARSSAAHGDIPVAAVELHDSARIDVEELLASARERLGVRAPRKIIVLEALPRNPAGKIAKQELAAMVAPGK
jgi:acyl-CoA synthetase (AMP-forming)/AMP-acid ligase II